MLTNAATWLRVAQAEPLSFITPPNPKGQRRYKRCNSTFKEQQDLVFCTSPKSPKILSTTRYTAMDNNKHFVEKIVVKIAARLSDLRNC